MMEIHAGTSNTGSARTLSVDVIIPAFNAASYLRETVDSVARQTVLPRCVIVVDDGSGDDTWQVLQAMVKDFPVGWLQPVRLERNVGVSAARNAGIERARADYVAFLDSDDIWEPSKLERQMEAIRAAGPAVGVFYCDYRQIDEAGHLLNIPRYKLNAAIRGDVRQSLHDFNSIAGSGSAVVIRRELFERVGLFDTSLGAAEDWDMWVRLAQAAHFDYVDEALVRVRRHGKSLQADPLKMADGELAFLNKQLQHGRMSRAHLKRLRQMVALHRIDITSLRSFAFLSQEVRGMFSGPGFMLWAGAYRVNVRLRKLVKKLLGMA